MSRQQKVSWLAVGALLLFVLALNFLSFRAASSTTEMTHTLSTYRTGETVPDSMASPFILSYAITGEDQLARSLATALQAELENKTAVDTTSIIPDPQEKDQGPTLLIDLTSDRTWTPFYGNTTLKAQIYYAYNGDAPWPLDEPAVFRDSPAVKADGSFTLVDTTWGLLSKPAYNDYLAQTLAERIAAALQNDVFAPVKGI